MQGGWGPPGGGPPPGSPPGYGGPGYPQQPQAPQGQPPQQGWGAPPQPQQPQPGFGPPPGAPPYGAPPAGGYGAPPPAGYGAPMQQPGWGAPPMGYAPGMAGAMAGTICPRCQSPNTYKPSFTWWGGILGPWLFNHQICRGCGFGYNRKTGKSNTTAIAIYFAVIFVIVMLLSIVSAAAS